jgi:flagellar protein FlbD
MIKVTKLDGTGYYINPAQIEYIEVNPDTTLVMQSGRHYILRDDVDSVLAKIEAHHRDASPPAIKE